MPAFHQPRNSIGNHTYNAHIYSCFDFSPHFHKNYEVIYVIKGKALCTINNCTKVLEEGDFALCLSNEIHSVKSIGDVNVWIGVFSEDFIYEFREHQKGKTGLGFSFRCPDNLMGYLKENLLRKDLSDVFMIKSCLYALCSEYLRQIPLVEKTDKHTASINNVVDFIEKNYKNNITLSLLAAELGYDYYYFSKIFNKMFSMSFKEYLNIYRFNEACMMLMNTDLPITNVAFESGFQSVRSFNNTFKRIAGVSPKEYRYSILSKTQGAP